MCVNVSREPGSAARADRGTISVIVLTAAAILLGACSSTPTRFQSGRSYGLTGGASTMAPAPAAAAAPRTDTATPRRDDPHANAVYRGGRDPVTGKAAQPAPYGGPGAAPAPAYLAPRPQSDWGERPQRARVAGRTVVEVGEGDTLYGISTKYRVAMNSIMAANGLKDPVLTPGQKLLIPPR